MRNACIIGAGMYAPEQRLHNEYFNTVLGEDVGTWLVENLTIRERRWCTDSESTADLCERAANEALRDAAIHANNIDLLIIATDTPEYISPSTASVVQHRLGASNAATFDVNSACAGFVTALDTATHFIRANKRYRTALVIGVYAMSKYLNKTDKKTVTLFADGAGAVVLQATENDRRGYRSSIMKTQGQYHDWMGVYAGGTKFPITPQILERGEHLLQFVKKFPKELNPQIWAEMIREMTQEADVNPNDIQHFFLTQININSIREVLEILGIPFERSHNIMDRFAYTGSACIPMAFADARQQGKLQPGDLVCFVGSGGGLSFAGSLFSL